MALKCSCAYLTLLHNGYDIKNRSILKYFLLPALTRLHVQNQYTQKICNMYMKEYFEELSKYVMSWLMNHNIWILNEKLQWNWLYKRSSYAYIIIEKNPATIFFAFMRCFVNKLCVGRHHMNRNYKNSSSANRNKKKIWSKHT